MNEQDLDGGRKKHGLLLVNILAALLIVLQLTGAVGTVQALGPQTQGAYIVQGSDLGSALGAVEQVGGNVTHRLGIIQAVGAELTPAQAARLQRSGLVVLPDRAVQVSAVTTDTVRDDFSSAAYTNNQGTRQWGGAWIETGDDGSASSGFIAISNGVLQLSNKSRSLSRSANLTGATKATLSLSYLIVDGFNSTAYVDLQASNDGATWTLLKRFNTGRTRSFSNLSFDVTGYISAKTSVRLVTSAGVVKQRLQVDNVTITYEQPEVIINTTPTWTATVSDQFSGNTYRNNDGTQAWSGPWLETMEVTDPKTGNVRVINDGTAYRLSVKGAPSGIFRSANLFGAVNARLTVTYKRDSFDADNCVAFYASNSSAQRGSELGRIASGANDSAFQSVSFDLSPYISSETRLDIATCADAQSVYGLTIGSVVIEHDAASFNGAVLGAKAGQQLDTSFTVSTKGVTGRNVGIAVIDTGFWRTTDLYYTTDGLPRVVAQYDAITDSLVGVNFAMTNDENGHGSHVTSLALSSRKDAEGKFYGVAPNANLITIKAFQPNGAGAYSDIIRAIDWAVTNKDVYGIRIINMSFSAPPQSFYWDDPLAQAVMRAWQAGIVVVAAAGNRGPDPMTVGVPGNVPYIITVGAVSDNYTPLTVQDDFLASFSSTGPTVEGFVKPEVIAPGGHMLGLMDANTTIGTTYSRFRAGTDEFVMSGTSQASAVVAGLAALVLEQSPNLTPDQVKYRLMYSATPALDTSSQLAYSVFQQGAGIPKVDKAVFDKTTTAANLGLDIAKDLAGIQHFGGYANRDASGNYYLMDVNGMTWGSGYAWNGSYTWNSGFSWTNSYTWQNAFSWNTGFSWTNSYTWQNAYSWNTAWAWNNALINTSWVPQQ